VPRKSKPTDSDSDPDADDNAGVEVEGLSQTTVDLPSFRFVL